MRESVHQLRNREPAKRTKNLVQRKRKNKGLRESVHQLRRREPAKRTKDLVQRKRRNKGLRGSLHQVRSRGAPHHRNPTPEILRSARLRPGTLVSRNERSRCTKCTAASSIYYAFFYCKFKGGAPQARQRLRPVRQLWRSPRRPATPRRPGSASQVRQRPRHTDEVC